MRVRSQVFSSLRVGIISEGVMRLTPTERLVVRCWEGGMPFALKNEATAR